MPRVVLRVTKFSPRRVLRLVERDLHVALGGEVVDLVRPYGFDQAVETAGVGHVAVVEDEACAFWVIGVRVLEVVDATAVHARRAPHDTVHLVTLAEQQLRQV